MEFFNSQVTWKNTSSCKSNKPCACGHISHRGFIEIDLQGHDYNSQETELFFCFLMFGKHLELFNCYPKAHRYNNNCKCVKTENECQDKNKRKIKKKKKGVSRSEALVMAHKCVMLEHTQNQIKFLFLLGCYTGT